MQDPFEGFWRGISDRTHQPALGLHGVFRISGLWLRLGPDEAAWFQKVDIHRAASARGECP